MRDISSTTGRKISILDSLPKEVIPNPLMQYLTPFDHSRLTLSARHGDKI